MKIFYRYKKRATAKWILKALLTHFGAEVRHYDSNLETGEKSNIKFSKAYIRTTVNGLHEKDGSKELDLLLDACFLLAENKHIDFTFSDKDYYGSVIRLTQLGEFALKEGFYGVENVKDLSRTIGLWTTWLIPLSALVISIIALINSNVANRNTQFEDISPLVNSRDTVSKILPLKIDTNSNTTARQLDTLK